MEFQEGLMKLMIQKNGEAKKISELITSSPKRIWRFFHRSSSTIPSSPLKNQTPEEFICPISRSLMAEPVIVTSGQTFEAACVQVCKSLSFIPVLIDGSSPDFSSVIPNRALKSTIFNWCKNSSIDFPKPLDFTSAEKLVRTSMYSQKQNPNTRNRTDKELIQGVAENPHIYFNHAATEVTRRRPAHFYSSSSEESVNAKESSSTPPLPLKTRPSCYSSPSSSSSESETLNPNLPEEEEIFTKLRSTQVYDVEEAVISLRNITRTREGLRAHLCTPRLLSALRSLIVSRYAAIQVNSVAALVNLSLEKHNKVKIVRSGILPNLIDILRCGSSEVQEHASGALFSLALDDNNKAAIGVLGALPPLIRMLRSENERARHDSALALYHLSLVQSNRSKLIKVGSVPALLTMVNSGHMTSLVLLILCNLASCGDGRAVLMDSGAVECMVEKLRGDDLSCESARESCIVVLYGLSQGGLRFKGLAKAVGLVEVLMKVEKMGSKRAREKARRINEVMKGRVEEEEEDVDWEELLESGFGGRSRLGGELDGLTHPNFEYSACFGVSFAILFLGPFFALHNVIGCEYFFFPFFFFSQMFKRAILMT